MRHIVLLKAVLINTSQSVIIVRAENIIQQKSLFHKASKLRASKFRQEKYISARIADGMRLDRRLYRWPNLKYNIALIRAWLPPRFWATLNACEGRRSVAGVVCGMGKGVGGTGLHCAVVRIVNGEKCQPTLAIFKKCN